MSQGVEIFNLARTAYLRILPFLGPAAQITATVALGATFLGPAGVFPGAVTGAALTALQTRQWVQRAIVGFTGLYFAIQQNPDLVTFVTNVLDILRRYLAGEDINQGELMPQ